MKMRVYLIEMPEKRVVRHRSLRQIFRRWVNEAGLPKEAPFGFAFYWQTRNRQVEKARFAIVASSLRAAQRIAEREWKALNGERCVC